MTPKLMRVRALLLFVAAVVILLVLLTPHARAQGAPVAPGGMPVATAPAPATGAGTPGQAPAAAVPAQGPGAAALAQAPAAPTKAFALQGIVVDSAGRPVTQQKLTLHRVAGDGSGAMVDSTTSDRLGRFILHVPAERDTSAVYFVATRWREQLYIGSPFKPPVPASAAYTVVVGVNPVNMGPAGGAGEAGPAAGAAAPGGEPQAAPPPSDSGTAARWFLAVILALVALGAVAYALLAAARERDRERRRELLARIAALDERAQGAHGDEAARLERQRAELLAELSSD